MSAEELPLAVDALDRALGEKGEPAEPDSTMSAAEELPLAVDALDRALGEKGEPATPPRAWLLTAQHAALLGPFVDYMGLGSIFPLIPYFVEAQGASVVWLGLIVSVQYAALTLGSQVFGALCDRRDPKRVMVAVLAADVALFFLSGVAPSVELMVLVRAGAGFFTPMPIGTAWIGIVVPDAQKAKAFHGITLAILSGFILGTALGGLTGDLFWACTASAAIALAAMLLILFGAPPAPPGSARGGKHVLGGGTGGGDGGDGDDEDDGRPHGVKKVLSTFEWRACALISYNVGQEGACAGPVAAYLFSTRFGYSPQETGWVFCGIVFCLLVVNVCLMDRIAWIPTLPRVLVLAACETPAYIGMIALFASDATSGSLPAHADIIFIVLAVCLFSFNAMLHPTSFDLGSTYADRWGRNCQGTVLGAQNSLFSLGQAVGPLVAAALLGVQTYLCFVFMYVGLVATMLANAIVYQRDKKWRLEQAAGASAREGDGGAAAAPPVTSDEVVAAPEKVAEAAV
jgi:DHA1 family multidrug resistance protein-like MFS transporter